MSIIQVMDSSKSGRAIYVAASSLIVVALALLVLQVQGTAIQLTLENTLALIPFVGGLSLLLLSANLERTVVEWFSLRRISGKKEKEEVKLRMAEALLYVAPWESSPKDAYSIEESVDFDLKRMLRSPQFRDQISELQQVFWILFLLPFTLIDVVLLFSFDWILLGVTAGLGLIAASLIQWRNREILNRIISYAYASWFLEGTSDDLETRRASYRMKSRQEEKLKASLELTKPVIDLATKGDWEGFDRKSRNLDNLVGLPGYDTLKWSLVEDYLVFLDWCGSHIHGNHASHVDVFLKNASIQIHSAISVLKNCRETPFDEEEVNVARMLHTLLEDAKDRETYLSFNIGCYESLDKESLRNLKDGHLEILGKIPFRLKEAELSGLNPEIKGLDRLSWFVARAAELELLDIARSLSLVGFWGTHLTTIMSAAGPRIAKAFLEDDVGFPLEQLQSVALPIREWIKQDDRTDPYKVIKRFEELKKEYPRNAVRKYAIAVQWDTIRSPDKDLHNAIEAITRFIDRFDAS